MRVQEVQIFAFEELTDEVKKEVIKRYEDCNVFYEWWDFIREDLGRIGLKLVSFNLDCGAVCQLEMTLPVSEIIERIIIEYGSTTRIHQIAKQYQNAILWEENKKGNNGTQKRVMKETLNRGFLHAMQKEYADILCQEYKYRISDAAIVETLEMDGWEFTEDGKRFD